MANGVDDQGRKDRISTPEMEGSQLKGAKDFIEKGSADEIAGLAAFILRIILKIVADTLPPSLKNSVQAMPLGFIKEVSYKTDRAYISKIRVTDTEFTRKLFEKAVWEGVIIKANDATEESAQRLQFHNREIVKVCMGEETHFYDLETSKLLLSLPLP